MTPQQNQQPRKVTVDLGPLAEPFAEYVKEHFGDERRNRGKSRAIRIAISRLLKRPPTKAESGQVPQGRPPKETE